ncbi:MAG: GntR family transcriptional regulator [Candidatus Hydrogenedentes bacterium]|nr:GntR family transcriptional regulator [Candidatus Hydrogenedentota bacterium]
MHIHLSTDSGLPIYLQIVNQVKYLVASCQLAPDDELPSIRALAERLLINPNTVARAYRDLEAAGIVTSRAGAGTRVANLVSPLARRERLRIVRERIDALLAEARQLGFDLDLVLDEVRKRGSEILPQSVKEE